MNRTIAFKTLGCRLNQCETDALASQFADAGYKIVGFQQTADVYVVNTCTVTQQSDHKSRNLVSQAVRKSENAVIVVAGCMVNNYREQLKDWSNVTYLIDNEHKSQIFQIVESHFSGELIDHMNSEKSLFGFLPAKTTFHTRSLIKIQDGCDNFCTFCIIPKVRGRAESRPYNEVLENIRRVLDYGFREIVLTGVNIGRYQYEDVNFDLLVEKVLELPGDFRLRISSIEPEGFGDRFIELINHPKMTPHLHLCLQSGSDEILYKMKRKYNVASFMKIVDNLRSMKPDFNLTTDIIVGFPGESDPEFVKTVDLINEVGFSHVHTFKFSTRTGTRAEKIDGHIPEKVKSDRSLIIRNIADENKLKYYKSMIGKTQTLLVEKQNSKGLVQGYGEHFLPLLMVSESKLSNTFNRVILEQIIEEKEIKILCKPVN